MTNTNPPNHLPVPGGIRLLPGCNGVWSTANRLNVLLPFVVALLPVGVAVGFFGMFRVVFVITIRLGLICVFCLFCESELCVFLVY